MSKKVAGMGLMMLIALLAQSWGETISTIHSEAATCRYSTVLSEICWNNCVKCHERTDPILPLNIYATGDRHICEPCHPEQAEQGSGSYLLNTLSGGNHQFNIFYLPEASKTSLVPSPSGPKLFTDEGGANPKVHCSTCHDSMSDTINLLRVNNQGSALCLSCHRI